MQWEVCGADRVTGRGQTLVLDADDEASAVRRGSRRGLVVERARPLDPEDSAAGTAAIEMASVLTPLPSAGDAVGYTYVAPSRGRGRKKKRAGGGAGVVVAVVVALVAGGGWYAWRATRPVETVATDESAGTVVVPGTVPVPNVAPNLTASTPRMIPAGPKGPLVPSLHVTAAEVLQAYQTDRKLTDATYAGRTIAVQGRVETVGRGIFGTPCIGLGGSGGAGPGRILCAFGEEDVAAMNAVWAGDTITVVGRYDGANGNDVQLVGCQVSSSPATRPAEAPATQPAGGPG